MLVAVIKFSMKKQFANITILVLTKCMLIFSCAFN